MRRESIRYRCATRPTECAPWASRSRIARGGSARRAYTLLEVLLVLSLMVILASMVMLSMGLADSDNLVTSAKDFRSLLVMTRAMAMSDGRIYRIRLDDAAHEEANVDKDDPLAKYQPIVERQIDPIEQPYEYEVVTEPWASDVILRKGIRAYAIVFGEPTFEDTTGEDLESDNKDDPKPDELAPIVFTPDGKSEWMTVWLTTAPEDEVPDDPEFHRLSLVMDGRTSQIFIQQPLNDQEIELLQSYNLAPLIRSDRIDQPRLTEANILKLDHRP